MGLLRHFDGLARRALSAGDIVKRSVEVGSRDRELCDVANGAGIVRVSDRPGGHFHRQNVQPDKLGNVHRLAFILGPVGVDEREHCRQFGFAHAPLFRVGIPYAFAAHFLELVQEQGQHGPRAGAERVGKLERP